MVEENVWVGERERERERESASFCQKESHAWLKAPSDESGMEVTALIWPEAVASYRDA
jgi:hypothetical protein